MRCASLDPATPLQTITAFPANRRDTGVWVESRSQFEATFGAQYQTFSDADRAASAAAQRAFEGEEYYDYAEATREEDAAEYAANDHIYHLTGISDDDKDEEGEDGDDDA
jgi:hypothetical protein